MSMIFPGMDPYLENPQLWPGVHNSLIIYLRDQLQPLLRPRYIAAVEERVYVESLERQYIPDVWIQQSSQPSRLGGAAAADVEEPLYPHRLREPLPRFGIPLAGEDPDVPLDLQAAIAKTHEAGAYRNRIDYTRPCEPPLPADEQAWANELIGRATP
jgi:hypothetical protein